MHFVYWIKRKEYTDPYTQGYIGVSNNPQKRLLEHYKRTDNLYLKHALEKYDDIELVILHSEDSRDTVVNFEFQYRPDGRIGWNIIPGGDEPPRNHLTEEVRGRISKTHKAKGTRPYCANTHSTTAIEKRKASMIGRKWFYDPVTGAAGLLYDAPAGWKLGRKGTESKQVKVRGTDYICNVKTWVLYINDELVFEGPNLKQFMEDRGMGTIYPRITTCVKTGKAHYSRKFKSNFRVEQREV
jgi:predicted GIY-YIG superfamily endonuclease